MPPESMRTDELFTALFETPTDDPVIALERLRDRLERKVVRAAAQTNHARQVVDDAKYIESQSYGEEVDARAALQRVNNCLDAIR